MEVRAFHKDGRPMAPGTKVPKDIQIELLKLIYGSEKVERSVEVKEVQRIA